MLLSLCALSIVTALLGWATIRMALDLHDTRQALAIVIGSMERAGMLDTEEE